MSEYLLEMKDIVKTFPGVKALKGVNLKVRPGEVHALVGENGAGKSTLMKCLIGIQEPTSGEIIFDGETRRIPNTKYALDMGISMIHQELNPVLYRPIMENIYLGREPKNKLGLIDHKKMYDDAKELLASIGMYDDPRTIMETLTVAKMQMIEIAKAVSYDAKLIIMDEPTSALTEKEVGELFTIIRQLKAQNRSIIYISHKLDEIYEITDMVTVFRDGEYIGTEATATLPVDKMIKMMVGREVTDMYSKATCEKGDVILEVKNLSNRKLFRDISFEVRKGEILGFAGLIGSGRTEVMETIFGIRHKTGGEVFIHGKKMDINSPRDAIDAGMAMLTEDRRGTGIFSILSVQDNMSVVHLGAFLNKLGLINYKKLNESCFEYRDSIRIKTPSLKQQIQFLSGGNQQKVLVARWLMSQPEILILDEPTRGIDVGAKAEIYKLIEMLANMGKCIIMVSSELPEVMGMSDRIVVMHEGSITGILDNYEEGALTQEEIMSYATRTVDTVAAN